MTTKTIKELKRREFFTIKPIEYPAEKTSVYSRGIRPRNQKILL